MAAPKKTIAYYKNILCKLHDNVYSYDDWTHFERYHDKIPIICSKHGVFHQSLANHLTRKAGCPVCSAEKRKAGLRKLDINIWIDRANAVHHHEYEYLFPDNFSSATINPVQITCKVHGAFMQKMSDHVGSGAGCPKCASTKRKLTVLSAIGVDHYKKKHISSISLSRLEDADWLFDQHINHKRTLYNIAQELGVQDTTVGKYTKKHKIATKRFANSTGEKLICSFISAHIECIGSDRTVIPPLELDIFIPSKKIAIEYCGLYWHSDVHKTLRYHQHKMKMCNEKGIRLITLFEDEWKKTPELVKQKLLHLLGKSDQQSVYARKCDIRIVSTAAKQSFFNANHIQGDGPSSLNIGLYHDNTLVACMGMIQKSNNMFILNRYATSCIVQGGFSKLLSYFKKNVEWNMVESFADLRWSNGDLYKNTGWRNRYIISPDYYWTDGTNRFHKFGFRHRSLATKFENYNPELSENENCKNNGLYKIYDCGKIKYTLHNHKNET